MTTQNILLVILCLLMLGTNFFQARLIEDYRERMSEIEELVNELIKAVNESDD